MRRAVIVVVAFLAVYGFSQQTSSSPASSISTQVQGTASENPANTENQKDQNRRNKDQKDDGRKWHVRLGSVSVAAGYNQFSYPFYSPYGFYPLPIFYSSLFWDSYWPYSYPAGYFSYNDSKGEVRLSAPKEADVYLDNAYAGKAEKLKSIWLEPGAYDLSVAGGDGASYHRRIYVLSGKSLRITAKFEPQTILRKPEEKP